VFSELFEIMDIIDTTSVDRVEELQDVVTTELHHRLSRCIESMLAEDIEEEEEGVMEQEMIVEYGRYLTNSLFVMTKEP